MVFNSPFNNPLVDFKYLLLVYIYITELISIHGIYAFYMMDYTSYIYMNGLHYSFPLMVFNREPLVDFKYPLLVLLIWVDFHSWDLHILHDGLYFIYLYEWITIPSHSWFLIENH